MADGQSPNPSAPSPGGPSPDAALHAAKQAVDDLNKMASAAAGGRETATPLGLPTFSPAADAPAGKPIDLLSDVNLNVKIELGRTHMLVEDVLRLNEGAVVELDKLAGDPVDVYVNERLVARGEVLVLNDNFCVRISEIVSPVSDAAAEAKSA
jgi:flagellar motor switch protein FliN/FliY